MTRRNKNVQELKEGDKVITDFFVNEENVVRTVLWVQDNPKMESGREVVFDGGEKCPCCGKSYGTPLSDHKPHGGGIDAAWAVPITQ